MPLIDPKFEWMQTFTGKRFHFQETPPEDIDIVDIAHALSNKPRFGGHLDDTFSVAQHSLVICRLLPPEYALEGLLHDCAEAYLPDVYTPLKMMMKRLGFDYNTLIEEPVEKAIFSRFDLQFPLTADAKFVIKKWDWISVLMERELFARARLPWEQVPYEKYGIDETLLSYDKSLWEKMQVLPAEEVKNQFLQAFKYLAKERFGLNCLPKYFDIRSPE